MKKMTAYGITAFVLLAVFALVAVDVIGDKLFYTTGPPFEATYKFQHNGQDYELALSMKAIHLFLAEYDRELILRSQGKVLSRKNIFTDTGGYSTTNVYSDEDGNIFIRSSFPGDNYKISLTQEYIKLAFDIEGNAKYMGAFLFAEEDKEGNRDWIFSSLNETSKRLVGSDLLKMQCLEKDDVRACSDYARVLGNNGKQNDSKIIYSKNCEQGVAWSCAMAGDESRYISLLKKDCTSKSEEINDWVKKKACETLSKKYPEEKIN